MIGIYKIENIINGKKYIGSSINIEKRIKRHKNDLKNQRHINIYLQREYQKYGINNFIFDCIEECEREVLKKIEQKYLNNIFLIENNNNYYYNIGKEASGGDNLTKNPNRSNIIESISEGLRKKYQNESEETRNKRRENLLGEKNPNFGKKWNEEQRSKMSNERKGLESKLKGKTFEEIYDEEKVIKLKTDISKRAKERTGEKNPNFGKKCPEHLKKHYSNIFKNKRNKNALTISKPFSINNENYVLLQDAAAIYNVSYLTIRNRLLSNNVKFSNYKYITDENKIKEILMEYKNKYL